MVIQMYIEDITAVFAAAMILLAGVFGVHSYYTQKSTNEVRAEVFGKITNTTTNQEIIGYIHDSCGRTPWYVWRVDCESVLLKTFITPTKGGY